MPLYEADPTNPSWQLSLLIEPILQLYYKSYDAGTKSWYMYKLCYYSIYMKSCNNINRAILSHYS